MEGKSANSVFAPMLYLSDVAAAIEFYKTACGALELRRWDNPDGTVHVAELAIGNALFHLHQETADKNELSPVTLKGTSVIIGLFTDEPDAMKAMMVTAGATETSAMQDFEYGYRQGNVTDPFGHHWVIQKKI